MDYYDPTSVIDTSGAVQERYRFSAFGLRTVMNAAFDVQVASEHDFEFGYKGQFVDPETGYYDYGFRYYMPETGRWASRYPIGEEGGVNLYAFVRNDGVGMVDKFGLAPKDYGCCTAKKVKDGRDYLNKAWDESKKDAAKDPSDLAPSCVNVNTNLLGRMGEIPNCWECDTERRDGLDYWDRLRFMTNDTDHWIIRCIAVDDKGVQTDEVIYDDFGGMTDYKKFCKRWPKADPDHPGPDVNNCRQCRHPFNPTW
jgi:RHS repeat-associated protein